MALAVAAEMGFDGRRRDVDPHHLRRGDPARAEELRPQPPAVLDHAERKQNVDMSLPYFTSNQAIVALADSPAEGATTIADLKDVKFGAQAGTTSYDFITEVIQPNQDVFAYDDNVGAKAALEANQIDAACSTSRPRSTCRASRSRAAASSASSRPSRRHHRRVRFRAREGQPAHRVRRRGDHRADRVGRARRHPAGMAVATPPARR